MADELDFSVPQAKRRKGPGNSIIIILLLAVLAVGVADLWQSKKGGNKSATKESLTVGQLKELASKLASRNFYAEAVETWKQYFETAKLSSEEEARTLFTMGDLLLKADKPEEALGYFYRSEMVKQVPELKGQINEKIKECFEKAGQFAALRYEIMERTSYKPNEEDSGSEVVAQIGAEKITAAQLGAMLEDQLDVQLRQYKELLPPEKFNAQKEALRSQFDNPQVQLQFLGQMMAEEALQREALAEKLDEDTTIKQQLQRMRRQFLAQQYMEEQLAGKTHVDEIDVQTYYQAHEDEYKTEDGKKSLEEVKDEIYQKLSNRKRQELQQELIQQLMDKYNIVIHQDAIMGKKAETNEN